MEDTADTTLAAEQLLRAYETKLPIQPLVEQFPELHIRDAYEIQTRQTRHRLAAGAVVKGHKVGLTSLAMQRQMGVDQPDYGVLFDDMFFLEHQQVPKNRFLQPRVEPEVAFVLRRGLTGPGVTVAEVLAAVDMVLPALEIIDSRIADWKIGIVDTIADNASSGGVVLGSTPARVEDVDLRLSGCTLHLNGELVATGAGGAVLGSPVTSLVWLVNTLGPLGVSLEPGHVVLPGSITASVPVRSGDVVRATFAGIGSVTARFA